MLGQLERPLEQYATYDGEQVVGRGYKARGQKEQIRISDLGADNLYAGGFGVKLVRPEILPQILKFPPPGLIHITYSRTRVGCAEGSGDGNRNGWARCGIAWMPELETPFQSTSSSNQNAAPHPRFIPSPASFTPPCSQL